MKRSRGRPIRAEAEIRRHKIPKLEPKVKEPTVSTNQDEQLCFINQLPDDLVMRIFKHLDIKVIAFLLPQVCIRWSTLMKSEDFWKENHLCYNPFMSKSEKAVFFKCLKMAPVLSALTLELEYKDGFEFSSKFKVKPPQKISAFHFIYDNMPPDVMFTLLKKHKDNVEKLMITDTYTPYIEADVRKLWNHIQNLTKLKQLIVDGAALFYYKALLRRNAACWKTLRILDVKDCVYENMNTVQKLILVNPNWTEVYLSSTEDQDFRREIKTLFKCTDLDTVQVPFCKEFKCLAKCTKLESLVIDCLKRTEKEVSGVVTVLRKSTFFPNLKTVKIIGVEGVYVKLLTTLVQGHPEISFLNLVSCEISPKELLAVLKYVPGLKRLFLHEIPAKCIVALANEVINGFLPELTTLSVVECVCENDGVCAKCALGKLKKHRPSIVLAMHGLTCSCKLLERC